MAATAPANPAAAPPDDPASTADLVDDLLEDVSIDGMCGVY